MDTTQLTYNHIISNDKVALAQIVEDYETYPAKGLIHGLQKDAIQNSLGAAKNYKSLTNWEVEFEVTQINGEDALIITDRGTTGLTGEILSPEQIIDKSANGELDANQNLSRFLSIFNSGGNTGPGSYGRGKLVFQACSKDHRILCDSYREDNTYISFERKIMKNRLMQTPVFEGDEAKYLIRELSNGALLPLSSHGTRIVILNINSEADINGVSIKQAFLNSFDEDLIDEGCLLSLDNMIQETWWEILLKYNPKITLKGKGNVKNVELKDPILSMVIKKDKEDGWNVYEKSNITIRVNHSNYRIKRIRFAVAPKDLSLHRDFQEIYVQRKRMKIGQISKNIPIDKRIGKRLTGIIELDNGLEDLMLEPENLTHYGYKNFRSAVIREIVQEVRKQIKVFQEQLGLIKKSGDKKLEQEIQEALKELNEKAGEFGLSTSFGSGKESNPLKISFKTLELPNPGSLRVEYIDSVGPVKLEIKNTGENSFSGILKGCIIQQGNNHSQILTERNLEIPPLSSIELNVDSFKIDTEFHYEAGVMVMFEIPEKRVRNSRMLWLGMEKPDSEYKHPFSLTMDPVKFPNQNSRRVEIGDYLRNFHFVLTNNLEEPIRPRVQLFVRRGSGDRKEIAKLMDISNSIIPPMVEGEFICEDLKIEEDLFGFFMEEDLNHDARKCELYLKVNSAEHYEESGLLKGDFLVPKKKIPFWIGIDDPGLSLFSTIIVEDLKDNPRRSWFEGNSTSGYSFHLNQGHPSFSFISELDQDGELKTMYYKEEMLKQAFLISITNENYNGLFKERSTGGETYEEIFKTLSDNYGAMTYYEEVLGKALHKMYS